jgi:hypothetical protein
LYQYPKGGVTISVTCNRSVLSATLVNAIR